MFANQRRGTAGVGSIAAVAAIIVLWLAGTGLVMKTYREGGARLLPEGTTCQVVCNAATPAKG